MRTLLLPRREDGAGAERYRTRVAVPRDYRCECGHLASQHTDDTREHCTVPGCGCEGFLHDEQSWALLAQDMAGRSGEVLEAVSRSLKQAG